jgi:hypothetical protein
MIRPSFLAAVLAVVPVLALAADPPAAKPLPTAGPFPSVTPLPDPMAFADGKRVVDAHDWPQRRQELLEQFQKVEYGRIPKAPKKVTAALLISHKFDKVAPGATHRQYEVVCELDGSPEKVSFVLDVITPKGDGPFPVVLTGDWCWGKTGDDITKAVVGRGYALAEFDRCVLAPDKAEQPVGLRAAYPGEDFGCLAAWAWGYQRAVDAILSIPQLDKEKIAISGHSRGGKAVILAGAMDERIALVNPNAAGCGGTGCLRNTPTNAESIQAITTKFPFWFNATFKTFAGREAELPVDHHELKACVAPRALLDTEGINDVWANPRGAYRTHAAAKKVYEFLQVPGKIAIHYRPGGHEHNLVDWTALLDFADEVFFQKRSDNDWNANPIQ